MFLASIRKRLSAPSENDEGAVLLSVIGVSAVLMIICGLIAASSVQGAVFAASTRADLQSRASAEAGIDDMWTSFENANFPCTKTVSTAGVTYTATVKYYDGNGIALTCTGSGTLSGTPASAMVTSEGTATSSGVAGATAGNKSKVIGVLGIVINESAATLNKVFFSQGSYTIANSTDVYDSTGLTSANLYSNGDITCQASDFVQGNVYVQGNFYGPNTCNIAGSVWAGGGVSADTLMQINGDVLSQGGATAPYTAVNLDKTAVGGSVVANGNITFQNSNNSLYCSVAGYPAKVCGSVVSILGSIAIDKGAQIGGNAYAYGDVDLGITGKSLIVGGNLLSNSGNAYAKNDNGSGQRVGGWLAVFGSTGIAKSEIGNKPSTCANQGGFTKCNPLHPAIPLAGLPAVLNFPTNTKVTPPPRESLARINSDSASLATKWTGWTQRTVDCAALDSTIRAGWSGKLLLKVTGCTAPIDWDSQTYSLPGDLAVIAPSGFKSGTNGVEFVSSPAATKRVMMTIVPSDAKLADGNTPLVTWLTPIPAMPSYTVPSCVAGDYGDIRFNKITTPSSGAVQMFIYTPCDFEVANQLLNFWGQIYAGNAIYPNNGQMTYVPVNVPGAIQAGTASLAPVIVTEKSRFDARG